MFNSLESTVLALFILFLTLFFFTVTWKRDCRNKDLSNLSLLENYSKQDAIEIFCCFCFWSTLCCGQGFLLTLCSGMIAPGTICGARIEPEWVMYETGGLPT